MKILRILLLGACIAHVLPAQLILTSIVPSSATAGGAAFTLTLTGTFVAPPSTQATFGAVFTPPGGTPTTLAISDTSSTEIVATVPAGLIALPGNATVFATEQIIGQPVQDSSSLTFTIVPPTPVIDSLKPSATALSGPGITLGVIGTGFYAQSVVEWNGTPLTTAFPAAGVLSATVPAALLTTAGNQLITVSNGTGFVSNQFAFLVSAPAPSLSSLSPATVAEGGPAVPLTVTGTGFLGGADCANGGCTISSISFDGATLATTFVDRSHLTATIPVASLTIGTHTVVITEGSVVTSSLPFQVTALQPSLTALTPASAVQDGAAFTLTLTGAGFVGAPNCNGTNCLPTRAVFGSTSLTTTFVSGTQLTATVPASLLTAVGKFPVTVVNNALVSSAVSFAVFAPVLSTLSPSAAVAGGPGFTITAAGVAFQPASKLTWNGTALATAFVSATQVTATVPASLIAAAGSAAVGVVTQESSGVLTSNSLTFTTVAALVITSISPNTVAAGSPQLTLTVTGSGFVPGTAAQLNGSALATTYVSGTTLTAVVPQSALVTPGVDSIAVGNSLAVSAVAQVSNAVSLTIKGPSISSLLPGSASLGAAGFTLTVNGTSFGAQSTVRWNGTALATTPSSATQLMAVIPAALLTTVGTASVSVANGTAAVSNSVPFQVTTPQPSLTSLSPLSSIQDAAGFTLTLIGSGFVGPADCNGTNCAPSLAVFGTTSLPTTFVSRTELTAAVPASLLTTAGILPVSVVNNALISSAVSFTVFAPLLSSLSPPAAIAGGQAFTITAAGSGFQPTSKLTWNGTALATAFVSATQLTATVPASLIAAAGSAAVAVVTQEASGSLTSNSLTFTTATALVITSISPGTVAAGSAQLTLTVKGLGFLTGSVVELNKSPLATTFVSGTTLTAVIPQSALATAGVDSIVVANSPTAESAVSQVSNAVTLTVFKAPVISSLSPNSVSLGAAAFTLTINGTGFNAQSAVLWNGTTLVTSLISATQLTAAVPAALLTAVGTTPVSVSNGPGMVSNSLPFQITTLQPSLTSLSPASSIRNGAGFTLTLTGTGFVGPADCNGTNCVPSRAVFGTTSLQTTFVSRTQLTAIVPASLLTAAGAFPVTVVNGAFVSNAVSFLVALPVLSSLSPSSAVAGSPEFTLTATGTGFVPSSTLTWNGAVLATTFVSATELTAVVPAMLVAKPGSASVAVATLTLTSNTLGFTVNLPGPPSLTLSTPSSVGPAQQPTIGFVLNSSYPIPLDGTVTLTFEPNAAVPDDDPAIQFATGGRTLTFSLPANSTALPALNIQTGTVAGTITITVTLTAAGVDVTPPGSLATIVIPRTAPVITSVSLVRGASSVQLNVVGYSTSREVVEGVFQFTPAANNTFTSSNISVPLSTAFATWYQSAPGASYGSQFTLSQPFSLGGNSDSVASVTVTLQNTVGTSQPATAN